MITENKIITFSKWVAFMVIISLLACKGETKQAKSSDDDHHHEEENIISLTANQAKAIGLQLGNLEYKNLTDVVQLNGKLKVPNDKKAFVTVLYGGVVKNIMVQQGDAVKQGEVIATIVNPDLLVIQQELEQINNQIALQKKELARQEELVAGNAAPLKRLQQVSSELANLKARKNSLQQQLKTIGAPESYSSAMQVRAPIGGVVSQVYAQIGSNVDVSKPIFEIVNQSELHLDLFVFEKELPLLKLKQPITFNTINNPSVQHEAVISLIGKAFNENTSSIPVHAQVLGSKEGLIEGMPVVAHVTLQENKVQALPQEAVVSKEGSDYVFIQTNKPHSHAPGEKHNDEEEGYVYKKVKVVKGVANFGYVQVELLDDIAVKDAKFVVKGAFFLLAKEQVPTEHVH